MLVVESSVSMLTAGFHQSIFWCAALISRPVLIHPHPPSAPSRPVSGRSAAMRWRWSWQTARGASHCPGRRCRGWTPRASVKWKTWLTSPAWTRPRCCTTWERDTTPAWSMWGFPIGRQQVAQVVSGTDSRMSTWVQVQTVCMNMLAVSFSGVSL